MMTSNTNYTVLELDIPDAQGLFQTVLLLEPKMWHLPEQAVKARVVFGRYRKELIVLVYALSWRPEGKSRVLYQLRAMWDGHLVRIEYQVQGKTRYIRLVQPVDLSE